MVSHAPAFAPQELRTTVGGVFAYFVPAEEFDRMRAEIAALRADVARLARQKDFYIAELTDLLKTSIPLPPTEDELRQALADLVVELERE